MLNKEGFNLWLASLNSVVVSMQMQSFCISNLFLFLLDFIEILGFTLKGNTPYATRATSDKAVLRYHF